MTEDTQDTLFGVKASSSGFTVRDMLRAGTRALAQRVAQAEEALDEGDLHGALGWLADLHDANHVMYQAYRTFAAEEIPLDELAQSWQDMTPAEIIAVRELLA